MMLDETEQPCRFLIHDNEATFRPLDRILQSDGIEIRAPLNIHFLLRPAVQAAYCVALVGHITADMPFSRALSAACSLGLATKLNN